MTQLWNIRLGFARLGFAMKLGMIILMALAFLSAAIALSAPTTVLGDVPSCSNGVVVQSPESNPGLVGDCEQLIAAKDVLRAAPSLDWGYDRDITTWEGVSVGETAIG